MAPCSLVKPDKTARRPIHRCLLRAWAEWATWLAEWAAEAPERAAPRARLGWAEQDRERFPPKADGKVWPAPMEAAEKWARAEEEAADAKVPALARGRAEAREARALVAEKAEKAGFQEARASPL